MFPTTTTLLVLLLLLSIAVAGVDAHQHVYDMPLEEVVALLGTMPECGVSFFFFFFFFILFIYLLSCFSLIDLFLRSRIPSFLPFIPSLYSIQTL